MLVKKFEAKTMKQAIELVKIDLGPEAIILGVKENDRSFGLMGENSIEVTAAISESKYYEKRSAEKKLSTKAKETYARSSAKKQKEYIAKSIGMNQKARFGMTAAAISEEQGLMELEGPAPIAMAPAAIKKVATQRQYIDIDDEDQQIQENQNQVQPVIQAKIDTPFTEDDEVMRLKQELNQLKGLLTQFKSVPQSFMATGFKAHPGAEDGVSYELSSVFEKMLDAGLNREFVLKTLNVLTKELGPDQRKKKPYVEGWLIKHFMNKTLISSSPSSGRYHVFLGPTGQGKTSTIVKFASHLVMKEKKKVAILSGDSVKVGAQDQLKIYAQILNIPFGTIDSEVDWRALDKQLEKVDVILIDSPGVNLKGAGDIDYIRRLIPKNLMQVKRIHFVQSIMARDQDAFDIIDRFKLFGIDDIIFTRLDEAVQFGSILNFVERFQIPIHSFGTSSDVPDGFEFASKERIVDLIFGLSKVVKEGGRV